MFYADDAFAGLHIMEDLIAERRASKPRLQRRADRQEYAKATAVDEETGPVFAESKPGGDRCARISPSPPFWGCSVRKDYELRELFTYINETALFKNQWQLEDCVAGRLSAPGGREIPSDQEEAGRRSARQRNA